MKALKSIILSVLIALLFPTIIVAETIGVFFNSSVEQIKFAAGDVKTALESKNYTVEMLPLSSLTTTYANKKVVIALSTDDAAIAILISQGGTTAPSLGEQAYALRTTTNPQSSFWALGGDANGAMYGGLQIAENINFNGLSGVYNNESSPKLLKRGIKLNLPFDKNSTTYFNANISTGARFAITNVWDITFWQSWFDEMARNRFNVLSVWSNHPFTSMIKMADYPDVAIQNVTGYPNYYDDNDKTGAVIKTMTIDEKIVFWKQVMAYAKSRGFSFYLFNWNLFLYGAEGKYGIVKDIKNQAAITYLRKCMYELFQTYSDLDGFGITQGEAMGDYTEEERSVFLGQTYGMGLADYAKENPTRKLNFIHRWWFADFNAIKTNFSELMKLPNVTFDMSYKYSMGHMYSSTKPDLFQSSDINALVAANLKTWYTVRNDDYFYHNWGSPDYAREYFKNMPGQGTWLKGFYMGSDGYNPTRTFFSKNSVTQGLLEVQRMWYMNMIWGRLAYDPNLSDDVFKNTIKLKYPTINSDNLYSAWNKVSAALPRISELFFNDYKNDQSWYPENCQDDMGFLTITKLAAANPRSGSTLAGITNSALNNLGGKISTYANADKVEADATTALTLISDMNAPANSELGVTLTTIKAMSYLSIYYAYKIRGATFNVANKKPEAISALGTAYCWWMKYTNLMDANFKGMSPQRNFAFATWHQHDAAVLKEYTDLGGTGTPNCGVGVRYTVVASSSDNTKGTVTGAGEYNADDIVEVKATPKTGYRFINWTENNVVVSTELNYKFLINGSKTLVANFIEANGCAIPWTSTDITVNSTTITDRSLGVVNTTCSSSITISADVEGLGGLDPTDYCRIYYKINGGTPQPLFDIINLRGAFAKQTHSKTVTANTIELIVNSLNTASDEIYKITNIKIIAAPTAIENIDYSKTGIQGVIVYPNPAKNVLNVDFQTEESNREIKLFNTLGQLMYQTKAENLKNKIDIKAYNLKGVVTIQVISGEKKNNLRVLVN